MSKRDKQEGVTHHCCDLCKTEYIYTKHLCKHLPLAPHYITHLCLVDSILLYIHAEQELSSISIRTVL